ncbi:MAG: BamA/TamA family outer membrane protein [Polyangiaceae bacterium]|nr:BamA/TamA family outer membrane protein [Polyangiaceae bacterium]
MRAGGGRRPASRWAAALAGLLLVARAGLAQPRAGAPAAAGSTSPAGSAGPARATWGSGAAGPPPGAPAGGAPAAAAPESAPTAAAAAAACPDPPACEAQEVELEPAAEPDDPPIRYELERVDVRGLSRTSPRVVLRYLPFAPGDVIDVDDPEIELSRYRLLGTGFFRSVELSLDRGSRRGAVVLVVEVEERNTVVINGIWLGVSADADTQGNARPLTAYGGLDVAETNLAGTGITLGGAVGVARDQLALRVRFFEPTFLGDRYMTSASLVYNDARDFFGNTGVQYSPGLLSGVPDYAVVDYQRFGGTLGVGRDLGVSTQLWVAYRLERVQASVPIAASHRRGLDTEPIDFSLIDGGSNLSTLRASLQHDTRDHPFLPTRGWLTVLSGEAGLQAFASDYGYQRAELAISRWWKLPWYRHVLRLELFGGIIAGDAPFFEQYYVGDFSDFLPARVLGMNVDRRPSPNLLGTDILEVRYGEVAAKVGGEYRIPLYRGRRAVYGIDLFASAGLFSVAARRDLTDPPRGYSGAARVPLDLTANLGTRIDTSAGGFVFSFSNILGFVPVRNEDRPR